MDNDTSGVGLRYPMFVILTLIASRQLPVVETIAMALPEAETMDPQVLLVVIHLAHRAIRTVLRVALVAPAMIHLPLATHPVA